MRRIFSARVASVVNQRAQGRKSTAKAPALRLNFFTTDAALKVACILANRYGDLKR